MEKKVHTKSTWSVKYEFSSGPHWLAFWYGAWAFISDRKKRARFSTKEEARLALRAFQQTWYRPIGQTKPYILTKVWKHGHRPLQRSARISTPTSREYSKSNFAGPWDREQSEVNWVSKRTGLPMMLRRAPEGYLQGFVGIPRGNYLFGTRDELLNVHGGVSFCGRSPEGNSSFPDSDLWWFGFHAGHCTDIIPRNPVRVFQDSRYRTIAFMRKHCERLGEQIRRFDVLPANPG